MTIVKMTVTMKRIIVTEIIAMVVVEVKAICVGGVFVMSGTVGVGDCVEEAVGEGCGELMDGSCCGEKSDVGDGDPSEEIREGEVGRGECSGVGEGVTDVCSGKVACEQMRGTVSMKYRKIIFSIISDSLTPADETGKA